jgi:hypothetical protein
MVICLECQKGKEEHRHPDGFLQTFPILEWRLEFVSIDFITNIPRTMKKHDSIVELVDKLTKDTRFIPIKLTHKEAIMAKIYKWEDYLHLVEFSYNNGYHASFKMRPFDTLYGKWCNTLVTWDNLVERAIIGIELLREIKENMVKINQNLKVA